MTPRSHAYHHALLIETQKLTAAAPMELRVVIMTLLKSVAVLRTSVR